MNNIRELLGNAKMAYTNMNKKIDAKKIVNNIFDLLEENKENIEKANNIDVKNSNGFKIDFEMIYKIKNEMNKAEDLYRKVIYMYKNKNNYIEGEQTDNLGTICLLYDGNTYCLLEIILKSILTHNSIMLASESNYMKATNELIVILIQRILEAYKIDKNLVQILYTSKLEELLSNSISINKVIAIGNKSFQEKIKSISKIEVVCKGYNDFDLYIEDTSNLPFIEQILKECNNINVYVKNNLKVPFEDYIEVLDIDEAIAQINFNTSGYSSSIFTDNGQNASEFLRDVKTANISVNATPLIKDIVHIDINLFLQRKRMLYPNIFMESEETENRKFEFPTVRSILEKNKNSNNNNSKKTNRNSSNSNNDIIKSQDFKFNNSSLIENNEELQNKFKLKLEQKDIEINNLKRQLDESHNIVNKYINIFRKSFFTRFFGKIKKDEIESDSKLLH